MQALMNQKIAEREMRAREHDRDASGNDFERWSACCSVVKDALLSPHVPVTLAGFRILTTMLLNCRVPFQWTALEGLEA